MSSRWSLACAYGRETLSHRMLGLESHARSPMGKPSEQSLPERPLSEHHSVFTQTWCSRLAHAGSGAHACGTTPHVGGIVGQHVIPQHAALTAGDR